MSELGVEPMDTDFYFKSKFYNLEGIHIKDRKKNFSKLLKSVSLNTPDEQLAVSLDTPDEQLDIQPRNYQENIFYVDVLIHFKKVKKLTDILQQGNKVLCSRILKQRWFFQEAFKNISEDDLINKFLPTLSYSLRMKVLKKLSLALSEERMDTIFDLVLERYGLYVAKQFLFSCSPKKIDHVLKNNEITLSAEQLKRLMQKDLDLLKLYINEYEKNMNKDFDDQDFFKYLSWKHPNLYFELGLNTKSNIFKQLGRRTMRAVIKNNKEEVLKDIKNSRFNKAALLRYVPEFDKEYLFLLFPDDEKTISQPHAYSKLESFLLKYPIKKRWEVLSQAFKKAYGKEIMEHLDKFEDNFTKFFPDEIQQKWAEIKYSDSNNASFLKYFEAEKAVHLLKDKINLTSDITQRRELVNDLITVCFKNKNYSIYEEVLKYICTRHRNEGKQVRANLISHISKNIDYNLITEAHWKYINELIDIQRVRNEHMLPSEVISQYLLFVCKNKLPLDGPVTQYIKDCIKVNQCFRFWHSYKFKEVEVESTVLKCIAKILPSIEHGEKERSTCDLMSNIVEFNKEIKNDKVLNIEFKKNWIDLSECTLILELIRKVCKKEEPYNNSDCIVVTNLMIYNCLYSEIPLKVVDENSLLDILKTMFCSEDNGYTVYNSVLEVIKKPKRNYFENCLLDQFFNTVTSTNDSYFYLKQVAIKHFLANEPEVIVKYFNVILSLDVKSCDRDTILDYGIIKKYYLGLSENVIAHFKPLLSVDNEIDEKVKYLNALSKVMNTKDFLDLTKDYIPKQKKLNLDDQEQRELYQIQCDLMKAFKNLEEVSMVAPVLMHFCQGDYFQSSLAVLHKVLYRLNEDEVTSYVQVLKLRALSPKKHAVYSAFKLLSLKAAIAFHTELSNKETNISAKQSLFASLLKYFLKNPLKSLLDIVMLRMDFIDKNDINLIRTLTESTVEVSDKYKPLYIERAWAFLDSIEHESKVKVYRDLLLRTANRSGTRCILRLNKSFCENVIRKFLVSSLLTTSYEIYSFATNFLLAYLDESNFKFVFNIIKSYKETGWEANDKVAILFVIRFFDAAYKLFDKNDGKFLQLFTIFWQQLFNHAESFTENIMLRLMVLYKGNKNIDAFSKEVDKLFQELTTEYGPYINELLVMSIRLFYPKISSKDNPDFNLENFTFYLLQSNSSELNCYVAFSIINNFINTDDKKKYNKALDVLKTVSHFTARVYCNRLAKSIPN